MRSISKVAKDWWDYTTLDEEILKDAARLTEKDIMQLQRPGFKVKFYDTLEEFYLAEALEYIHCWKKATKNMPTGICGPIGPTEQLPLVAMLVNELEINLKYVHFWAMDEWYISGREMPISNPLSFAKADLELCFKRINKELRMSDENMHFLRADNIFYKNLLLDPLNINKIIARFFSPVNNYLPKSRVLNNKSGYS